MTLTRSVLEQGLMRQLLDESGHGGSALTDGQLDAAADAALAEFSGEPWVFAYGSLIWNPLFEHVERRCALLRGYHRRFCLWSQTTRGTRNCPGLVLGLENGGRCRGVVFRIDSAIARSEFRLLWRREMLSGIYQARRVPVCTPGGIVEALAFAVDRTHPQYAGRLTVDEVTEVMRKACGRVGTSREYLHQTVTGLAEHGIVDPLLTEIDARVTAVCAEDAARRQAAPAAPVATDISILDTFV